MYEEFRHRLFEYHESINLILSVKDDEYNKFMIIVTYIPINRTTIESFSIFSYVTRIDLLMEYNFI